MNIKNRKNTQGTPLVPLQEISHYARGLLTINGRIFPMTFLIAGLGSESIILGLPWLRKINPVIDWKIGTFQFRMKDETYPEFSCGKGRTLIGRVQTKKSDKECLSWCQRGTEKKKDPLDMTKEERQAWC
ncbi:hypothetical protein L208DRAFT_1496029 [Tricholoma matsutake]|nr:hypothetical protein L208DRAFT_1496029 [Tricholoma matsutake 945]